MGPWGKCYNTPTLFRAVEVKINCILTMTINVGECVEISAVGEGVE